MRIPSMPFKIVALAPFRSPEEGHWRNGSVRIDDAALDQAIEDVRPSLRVQLPKRLCPSEELTLSFRRMKDFHPDGLAQNNPFLKNLLDARNFVAEAKTSGLSTEQIGQKLKEWPDLPPLDLEILHEKPRPTSSGAIDDILKMVALPEEGPGAAAQTQSFTAQIDRVVREILKHIFTQQAFSDLESVWRGLRLLRKQWGDDGGLALEIVPISSDTLDETLSRLLAEMVQDLPGLIVVDLPFDSSPRSLELLEQIAQLAESLMAPALCWLAQKFFYLDSWKDLKRLPYLPHYLEEQTFAKWRRLQGLPSGNWLTMVCNRFLLRYPYGPDNKPGVAYFEEDQGLWGSPVWALGSLICQSHVKTGWPTRLTDWRKIRLEDLALHAADGDKQIPTEASFSEDRIQQFVEGGITPLVSSLNSDVAFVPAETTVAGASLCYQLLVSRITQFLIWCKDNFDHDLEPAEVEKNLKAAFSLYWERSGQPGPEDLEVAVSKHDPEKPAVVSLMIEPSRQVLRSGERVELEFYW